MALMKESYFRPLEISPLAVGTVSMSRTRRALLIQRKDQQDHREGIKAHTAGIATKDRCYSGFT